MPTYEYKCDACGNAFENFQSMSSAPLKKCPKCGKNKVRRLIGTGAGLIFKGSGFYITDYRDSKYQESKKADGGNSGGGESKSESGSSGENKPASTDAAPKTETKSDKPSAPTVEAKPVTPPKEKSAKSEKK